MVPKNTKGGVAMKKLWIFVTLVLCIGCMVASGAEGADGRLKVLYPITATGIMVTVDLENYEGVQLAVQEINAAGGIKGRPVEVVTEDTTSTVPGAVQALQKLVSANADAVAIVGSLSSPFALAWDPIIQKTGIPFFTGATNVKITEQKNPWIFRVRQNDRVQADIIVNYVVDKMKAKRAGIFYDTNEFGKGGMENIVAALKKRGITAAAIEAHNTGDKDFMPQFLKFKNAKIDVLIGWNFPVEASLTVRTWHQLGRPFKLVGGPSYPPSPLPLSMVKEAGEGVIAVMDSAITSKSPADVLQLEAKYKAKFKRDMSYLAISGYDNMLILKQVIEKVGTDPQKMREALHTGVYKGLLATYQFDATGEGAREVSICQDKNGKAVELERIQYR
jgi:branched-chain amino acid transport system substrate-binding protein